MTETEKQQLDSLFMQLMAKDWYHEPTDTTVNLFQRGWTMGYNNRKRSFGVCFFRDRRIELSQAFINVEDSTFAKMEDTIRHEIAHAMEYEIYGTKGHGHRWKFMCTITGADGQRTHDDFAPKGRYEMTCNTHGVVHTFTRRPKRKYSCPKCSPRYNPNFPLKVVDTKC